jgi:DNA polymerase elongation subunit (family B)
MEPSRPVPVLPDNPRVFGADPSRGLLAFDLDGSGHIRVYRRGNDTILTERVAFSPFLLLADPRLLEAVPAVREVQALEGSGAFRWLVSFAAWPDAVRARDRCREITGCGPGIPDSPYRFIADPVHQYLLRTGRTSFVGLVFPDVRRLALDIEVLTGDGFDFPSAARATDRVIAISLADSSGFSTVLRGDRLSEVDLLVECVRLIRARDPDVIEGHNIFRFDLEYLTERARRHGVTLGWGRAGEPLRSEPAQVRIAERTIGYRRYRIAGRHVIDTWILAQLYDLAARDLPSFGLKDVARHLGVAAPGRTYIDPQDIPSLFARDPDRLMAYALDDALDTLAVSATLSPPFFTQAQILPFDYQSVPLRGTGRKVDALLFREHLRSGHAIPAPGPPGPIGGGLTAVHQQGIARPVLHVDVTSLYPSIMVTRMIGPASDHLGVFGELLRDLRDYRVALKERMAASTSGAERAHFQAGQHAFKLLINSFYGYLGFGPGHWNDFGAADRVTAAGRSLVSKLVEALAARGATVVEVDTDGVYFVPPADARDRAGEARLVADLQAVLEAGIQLELDSRYEAMFSYKSKNYALLAGTRLVTRGSALRSRGLEPFQRQIIQELLYLLLTGERQAVLALVRRWTGDFIAHRVPVRLFARTETLHDSLEAYREQRAHGLRDPAAAYEVALREGREYLPGDQVSYYVAGRGRHVTVSDVARLARDWSPAAPDENTEYYVARVEDLWKRFGPFAELDGLRPYRDEPPDDPDAPHQLILI